MKKFNFNSSIIIMRYYLNPLKILTRYIGISLICLSIFSCANKDTVNPTSSFESNSQISNENLIGNKGPSKSLTTDAATLMAPSKDENNNLLSSSEPASNSAHKGDYVLGPDDLIEISVYQVDELNRTVRVSSSGFINLPLAGMIKVSGLTAPELENEISKRLQKYLQEPIVSIFIKEYRSQSITVLGAVVKPQVYVVTRQNFLIDIISISGGLTKDAGDICYVRRGNETIIVNIKDLLIGGDMKLNIPVFSGDIIHVPLGGIIFVDGSVNFPGSFNMQGTITITQAIAMAKGLKFEAIRDEIKVYRDSGKATRDIIDIDYDAILEKKSPDIFLKDKDVLIVPKSGVKSFWNGFVQSLTGAFRFGSSVSVGAGF
jgi:polysaccharide export outer membrane protein